MIVDSIGFRSESIADNLYAEKPVLDRSAKERSHYHHPKPHVGPVYTFVKTDRYGNVKRGSRFRVGQQYG